MNSLPTTTTQTNDPAAASSTANPTQKEDYLDKALDSAEKKYGGEWGQDTQKHRGLNEKIVSNAQKHTNRPMVHATSSRKKLAKMFRIKSQTKPSSPPPPPPPPPESSSSSQQQPKHKPMSSKPPKKPSSSSSSSPDKKSDDLIRRKNITTTNNKDDHNHHGDNTTAANEDKNTTSWSHRLDEKWNRKIRPVIERMNGVM
ncbi:hypothetical protein DM02DRAFT_723932 [Periconia macrospinosa]|uniref:Uncharacterized protein n=1 Tax=Periconia macrospinosa TaxID=97972 RepID=A0A2V1E8X3_9PLEO|nr:hypothetical protein DM02DRAFT_723932 [Periconia macrospinosa]